MKTLLASTLIALATIAFGSDFQILTERPEPPDDGQPKTCEGGAEAQCSYLHFSLSQTVIFRYQDAEGNEVNQEMCFTTKHQRQVCYACDDKKRTSRVVSAGEPTVTGFLHREGTCGGEGDEGGGDVPIGPPLPPDDNTEEYRPIKNIRHEVRIDLTSQTIACLSPKEGWKELGSFKELESVRTPNLNEKEAYSIAAQLPEDCRLD